jgi:putative ABC transport system permease protein
MLKTAIRFLLYDKPKSIGALAGIVISIFLVGQQLGIFLFLTGAMKAIVENNLQYIWVVDSKTDDANSLSPLDMRIGRQIGSLPGVKNVHPVVLSAAGAKFEDGKTAAMTLVGTQSPTFAGGPWNLYEGTRPEDMLPDGAIITEFFDAAVYGDLVKGESFELNGRRVYNAGLTRGVRSFGGAPYAFTTIERARAIGNFSADEASLFLVEWQADTDPAAVIATINASIANVRAWDAKTFAASTVTTVLSSSGIAISIGSLILFAVISGFVIIGLTLYSSAIDRIRDYGTLKAMGASNGYIARLILSQAGILAIFGFILGRLLVEGFRLGVSNAGVMFDYPAPIQVGFFILTVFIALGGSVFAIRKISRLEPAQVFRG